MGVLIRVQNLPQPQLFCFLWLATLCLLPFSCLQKPWVVKSDCFYIPSLPLYASKAVAKLTFPQDNLKMLHPLYSTESPEFFLFPVLPSWQASSWSWKNFVVSKWFILLCKKRSTSTLLTLSLHFQSLDISQIHQWFPKIIASDSKNHFNHLLKNSFFKFISHHLWKPLQLCYSELHVYLLLLWEFLHYIFFFEVFIWKMEL